MFLGYGSSSMRMASHPCLARIWRGESSVMSLYLKEACLAALLLAQETWGGCQHVCMPFACFFWYRCATLVFAWLGLAERGCNCLGCFGSAPHPTSVGVGGAHVCVACVCVCVCST
jgi:hypothetical protein